MRVLRHEIPEVFCISPVVELERQIKVRSFFAQERIASAPAVIATHGLRQRLPLALLSRLLLGPLQWLQFVHGATLVFENNGVAAPIVGAEGGSMGKRKMYRTAGQQFGDAHLIVSRAGRLQSDADSWCNMSSIAPRSGRLS